jgi:hypothetical protein
MPKCLGFKRSFKNALWQDQRDSWSVPLKCALDQIDLSNVPKEKKCAQKFQSVPKKLSNKSLKFWAQTTIGQKKSKGSPFDVTPIKF